MSTTRSIKVSPDVLARIWSLRCPGENSEDSVLRRVLGCDNSSTTATEQAAPVPARPKQANSNPWVSDIEEALVELGGRAHLSQIYDTVRRLREAKGKSLPLNFNASVRKNLQWYSSDSDVFLNKRDLFFMPERKGAGIWALRKKF